MRNIESIECIESIESKVWAVLQYYKYDFIRLSLQVRYKWYYSKKCKKFGWISADKECRLCLIRTFSLLM